MPIKQSGQRPSSLMTPAAMKVRITWQTIVSLGRGAKMSTSAETFAADGEITHPSPNKWFLVIGDMEAPVNVESGRAGIDGVLFIERHDLLRVLAIDTVFKDSMSEVDSAAAAARSGSVQIALSRTPNRHMETIYRAQDEDLFLVKASAVLLNPM